MVSASRCPAGLHRLLHLPWHVVRASDLCVDCSLHSLNCWNSGGANRGGRKLKKSMSVNSATANVTLPLSSPSGLTLGETTKCIHLLTDPQKKNTLLPTKFSAFCSPRLMKSRERVQTAANIEHAFLKGCGNSQITEAASDCRRPRKDVFIYLLLMNAPWDTTSHFQGGRKHKTINKYQNTNITIYIQTKFNYRQKTNLLVRKVLLCCQC